MFNAHLTILFVFISFEISVAQDYIPFPDSNAVWTDYRVDVTCPQPSHICYAHTFYLNGDTTIGSYSYSKIFILPSGSYCGAIRNDIPAKKIYFVEDYTSIDTLLYDFNFEIGDTVTSTYLYNADNFPEPSIISAIDSIYSGGIYRKQYLVYNNFLQMELVYLIEGIGSTGGLFEGFYYPEGMSSLMCFRYNDTLYYPEGNSSLFDCEMPWQLPHCSDTTYLPTITGPLVVCAGDTIILQAESGYDSYLWSTGDTTQSIEVSDSGDYFVNALVDTCWFNSDTVEINVSNPQPIVTVNMNDLISSGGFLSYQWYINDTVISGAVFQTYCANYSGIYYVAVTDEFGCIGVSSFIEYTICSECPPCNMGIENNGQFPVKIYPNPATTTITLEFPASANFKAAELSIQTITGQVVTEVLIDNAKLTIDVEHFSKGLYLFKVRAGDEVVVRKVVVE